MKYTLVAIFLLTGDVYVERRHLSLQGCAGHAAMARQDYLEVLPRLNKRVGPMRWQCVPEQLTGSVTEESHPGAALK